MSGSHTDTHSGAPFTGGLKTSGPRGSKAGPDERPVEQHVHQVAPSAMENEPTADDSEARHRPAWAGVRRFLDGEFGEFFGTMLLVMFGEGATAQVVLSNGAKGSYQSISWGWGFGLMFGGFAAGRSGAHMNPAVTLAQCVYRRFPWRRFPGYAAAQLLGAMAGAALVYGDYRAAIDAFEGGPETRTVSLPSSTAGIFATYPAAFMTRTGEFFSEFLGTSLLVFLIHAMVDAGADRRLLPFGLLFLLFAIGACFGWETGYAVNPARDFGPRLVTYMLGYGTEVWSYAGYYFWVPVVAPFLGGLFGGFLFDVFRYEGDESPINSAPYLGFIRLVQPRKSVWSNTYLRDTTSAV